MSNPIQYKLAGLFVLVGLCSCLFGLSYWIGPALAIPVVVLPFCLVGERLLQRRDIQDETAVSSFSRVRTAALLVCALSTVAVVKQAALSGVPTVASPFPFLVVVPMFLGWPFIVSAVIPIFAFILILWPISRAKRGPIPMRASILLAVGTILSAPWLVTGWTYGVQYEGFDYTLRVVIINLVFICALWCFWTYTRRDSTFGWRLVFGTLLFYWLFWFAFPYLGELP